jgi:hypothetical protein
MPRNSSVVGRPNPGSAAAGAVAGGARGVPSLRFATCDGEAAGAIGPSRRIRRAIREVDRAPGNGPE